MASLGLAAGGLVPQDPDSKQVAAERYEAALQVFEHLPKPWETTAECETRVLWSRRVADGAAESGAMPRREALAQHLARIEEMMVTVTSLQDAGRRSAADVAVVRFHLMEAKTLAKR
jgi:hypothetical protein